MPVSRDSSNRFDALRLCFASLVAVYHLVALADLDGGSGLERWLAGLAEVSIQGFFIVSGALVLASLERSSGLLDYAAKRVRRLYPAYLVIILIPAMIALAMTLDVAGVSTYLAANLVFLNFLEPTLPGLFSENRFDAVNGALWTIKIEVMFYMALPLIAWPLARLSLRGKLVLLGALYLSAMIWRAGVDAFVADPDLAVRVARQLPGQMSFFAAGMALHLLWTSEASRGRIVWFGLIGTALLALSLFPALSVLRAVGLAGVIAFFAYAPGPAVPAARRGDMSYGIYIIHFPVVQAIVAAGIFETSPILGVIISCGLILLGAALMWRLVERPFLRPGSHYRHALSRSQLTGNGANTAQADEGKRSHG